MKTRKGYRVYKVAGIMKLKRRVKDTNSENERLTARCIELLEFITELAGALEAFEEIITIYARNLDGATRNQKDKILRLEENYD